MRERQRRRRRRWHDEIRYEDGCELRLLVCICCQRQMARGVGRREVEAWRMGIRERDRELEGEELAANHAMQVMMLCHAMAHVCWNCKSLESQSSSCQIQLCTSIRWTASPVGRVAMPSLIFTVGRLAMR